jgi:hypothetical protein
MFDDFEPLPSSAEVSFRGWPFDGWAISDTIENEIELNPSARRHTDATCEPLAAHVADLLEERLMKLKFGIKAMRRVDQSSICPYDGSISKIGRQSHGLRDRNE